MFLLVCIWRTIYLLDVLKGRQQSHKQSFLKKKVTYNHMRLLFVDLLTSWLNLLLDKLANVIWFCYRLYTAQSDPTLQSFATGWTILSTVP